jgi:hypothetical protein
VIVHLPAEILHFRRQVLLFDFERGLGKQFAGILVDTPLRLGQVVVVGERARMNGPDVRAFEGELDVALLVVLGLALEVQRESVGRGAEDEVSRVDLRKVDVNFSSEPFPNILVGAIQRSQIPQLLTGDAVFEQGHIEVLSYGSLREPVVTWRIFTLELVIHLQRDIETFDVRVSGIA